MNLLKGGALINLKTLQKKKKGLSKMTKSSNLRVDICIWNDELEGKSKITTKSMKVCVV